jgi:hypothetical protein
VISSRFIGSSGGANFSGKQKKFRAVYFFVLLPDLPDEPSNNIGRRKMKKMFGISVAVTMLAFASVASADTSSGTLTVTGTVQSSISLTVESAGGTTSGTGTAAATSDLGSISKFGSAPTGFTLARGASNWTLSSTVGVQVVKANLTSTDYTLTAQLGSAPASGVAWKLNGSTLSDSAATTLTSTGTYASTGSYSWDIVVADSAAAAAIDNAINFTATSN